MMSEINARAVNSTYDLLARAARQSPEREAIIYLLSGSLETDPIRLTYGGLLSQVTQAANLFSSLGVTSSDVVSLLLPNVVQAQIAFWGAEACGIANPINFLLSPGHIADVMNAAQTKVLVTLGPHPFIDLWEKVQKVRQLVPSLRSILMVGGDGNAIDGALPFDALLAKQPGDRLLGVAQKTPDDVAAYFHTGGTTGTPKLVQHTHENQVHVAQAMASTYHFGKDDVVLSGLPLFHVAGSMLLSLAPLSAGSAILLPTPSGNRDPLVLKNYWRIVNSCNATLFGGVPTSLTDILNLSDDIGVRPDGRRFCMTGGAQLSIGLQKRFFEETGFPVYSMYGMTETAGAITAVPRSATPRLGSVGKAIAGVEVKVLRLQASEKLGQPCGPREPGVVVVKGPNVTAGYYDARSGLKAAGDDDGWLNTGDLGYIDEDGWLYLTGRAKDVIIRSGHNIDPASIEEVAERHPHVRRAVAVGRPDLRAGEVPVVFVEANDGVVTSADAIKDYIIENIPEAPAKPAAVYIVPRIPMTAVGKIFRPALRRQAAQSLVSDRIQEMFAAADRPEVVIDEACEHAIKLLIRCRSEAAKGQVIDKLDAWLSQHTIEYAFI